MYHADKNRIYFDIDLPVLNESKTEIIGFEKYIVTSDAGTGQVLLIDRRKP